MLIALTFAHFSSELLLKEQMIIPVKKTLNNAGHIDAKLIDFSEICQKNPSKSAVFYWLFLGEVSPQNFPWNRPIFLRICPENPSKFDFFPLKSRKIGRFLSKFWLFSHEISRFLSEFWLFPREIGRFFREFAPENPAKFCFFFREISEALYRSVTISAVISQLIDSSMYCYGLSAFQCMLSDRKKSFIATRMLFLFAHI